ncbi:hypothetical protein HAX54_045352 [Datura stramonium]|uniref:Uncharacterized protein n=1 Tax=Datura stramonium TaxID=4076 RepID=A0ABS8WJG2_DATST|nr:hypothetical protein [Datura stramonium]
MQWGEPSKFLGSNSRGDKNTRNTVEEVPLYDSGEDKYFPVIFGTSGENEHTKILNDGNRSNNTCRNFNTGSGSTLKMKSQCIPEQKVKSSIRKQVKDGDFAKMFASKEVREEVSKYEGIKTEATSKLNSVYEEIRPIIELYGWENQDIVHTSVAKTWIEANCSKYKADLDLYFSMIKNVMCPCPATDATAAGSSEGGVGPQTANAEAKPSKGGA